MVLIAKGFGEGVGERQENAEKRASKSAMMSVLSELRTDEGFDSRPSLAVLAAVFGVLSRADPPTGRVWPNR
jgi:hypothetical protein